MPDEVTETTTTTTTTEETPTVETGDVTVIVEQPNPETPEWQIQLTSLTSEVQAQRERIAELESQVAETASLALTSLAVADTALTTAEETPVETTATEIVVPAIEDEETGTETEVKPKRAWYNLF
jgi:hypothetical protein